jgi:hypothetical protein
MRECGIVDKACACLRFQFLSRLHSSIRLPALCSVVKVSYMYSIGMYVQYEYSICSLSTVYLRVKKTVCRKSLRTVRVQVGVVAVMSMYEYGTSIG